MEEAGFTVAVVTSHSPVEVSVQHLALDIDPYDFFKPEQAPRVRDYPFDLNEADSAISVAGYEPTSGWQWTGTHWGCVVQPATDPAEDPRCHPERLPKPRAWEQGGYEE
jgi:hypothetical protein